ncbi:MAG: YdcF family protein [Eubacteriales bacterium]|nr:YdcF family protein [Eubacteriales bacterium]
MKTVLIIFIAILLFAGFLYCALTLLLIRRFAKGIRPPAGASVIVPGCQINGEEPSRTLRSRLEAARHYMEAHPDCLCVLSGGQGQDETMSEALCMYKWMTSQGIPAERLLLEDRSTTTLENLSFSAALLTRMRLEGNSTQIKLKGDSENARDLSEQSLPEQSRPGQSRPRQSLTEQSQPEQSPPASIRVAIATSGFHCFRTYLFARSLGLDAGLIPAHTTSPRLPLFVVREQMALLYHLMKGTLEITVLLNTILRTTY